MNAGLRTAIKSAVPDRAWNLMRDAWYRVALLRFWKQYMAGLRFDLFVRVYRTEGLRFMIPRELTSRTHRARFLHDTHERDERELVRRHVRADATVLELGACLGVVSCVINRLLGDPRKQVSVEANPQLIPTLESNRDINGCRFGIENCLIKETSDGSFYVNDCFVMGSADDRRGEKILVPIDTVEALERKHALSFDTLFMDIQGGEHEFFRENAGLLARCKTVIYEGHPHIIGRAKCDECREMLTAAGLTLVERLGLVEAWAKAPHAAGGN